MAQQYGNQSSYSVQMAGPFGSSVTAKVSELTVKADSWKNAQSPYSQVVDLADVSANSQVNIQLSVEQITALSEKILGFTATNDGGEVTVYAFGDKPTEDYTFQVTITEVYA